MSKLFEELKRRKVFRVAAAYAVVAWLLIQVADTVLPTFGAPTWVNQTLIFLFLIGFPVAILLAWAYEITPDGIRADSPNPNANTATPAGDRKLIYATFALVLLVAGFQIADRFLASGEDGAAGAANAADRTAMPETRTDIVTPTSEAPDGFALSPDGRQIVFVASDDRGVSQLWLRSLASTTARPLPGTDGARQPFWSPDSHAIGFFSDTELKSLDLGGDVLQTLARVRAPFGGAWGADNTLVFPTGLGALMRVSGNGGEAMAVTTLMSGQTAHGVPHFLPDGRRFLFLAWGKPETAGLYLGDIDGSTPVRLTAAESAGVFHPAGWLLWVRADALTAQRLDLTQVTLTGEPLTIADGVNEALNILGTVSVANTGLIAYRSSARPLQQLTWLDRSGAVLGTVGEPDTTMSNPQLSPDGRRVSVVRRVAGNSDIWLLDGARRSRFSFDSGLDFGPVWSPDGSQIVFGSVRDGIPGLYQKPGNGAGEETRLLNSVPKQPMFPTSWSTDGRFLLYQSTSSPTGWDVWALPVTGDAVPFVVLQTPFSERRAKISPDGGWVAYGSDESGRDEVHVRAFRAPGDTAGARSDATSNGVWQISTAGGIHPVWSPDGRELYYLDPRGNMMAVPIVAVGDSSLELGTPAALFAARVVGGASGMGAGVQYDVAPDGRFLINTPVGEGTVSPITLIQNWNPTL